VAKAAEPAEAAAGEPKVPVWPVPKWPAVEKLKSQNKVAEKPGDSAPIASAVVDSWDEEAEAPAKAESTADDAAGKDDSAAARQRIGSTTLSVDTDAVEEEAKELEPADEKAATVQDGCADADAAAGTAMCPSKGDGEDEAAIKNNRKELQAGGGNADSGAGNICYSVSLLKSLAKAEASQGDCPPSIPACLRNDADDAPDTPSPESSKRYKMEFLKQFKDKAACRELPVDHKIPKDIRAASFKDEKEEKEQAPRTPTAPLDEQDDWRAQGMKHQARMKEQREKEGQKGGSKTGRNSGGKGGRAERDDDRGFGRDLPKLQSSETSWALKQQETKDDKDEVVIRAMKSILNKLTLEKFDTLYAKLLESGISTKLHIEILMREVFEKATTQHHFIEMYTCLCIMLNDWLTEKNTMDDGEAVSFKRILLNQCQDSFEKNLKPPEGLSELVGEEQVEARFKYKTRMLGNIKFVGQLLINKVLSSKIIFQCIDELFFYSSEETLETLCAFLQTIGPAFDTKDWKNQDLLTGVFNKVRDIAMSKTQPVSARVRCLLKDVLDLRATGWNKKGRPSGEPEGPKRMADVKLQWAKDHAITTATTPSGASKGRSGAPATPSAAGQDSAAGDEWSTVGSTNKWKETNARLQGLASTTPVSRSNSSQLTPSNNSFTALEKRSRTTPKSSEGKSEYKRSGTDLSATTPKSTPSGKISLTARPAEAGIRLGPGASAAAASPASPSSATTPPAAAAEDSRGRSSDECRKEVSNAVKELMASHDVDEAVTRIRELKVPQRHQKVPVADIVSQALEARELNRPKLWELLVRLCSEAIFQKESLLEGMDRFFTDSYEDAIMDSPMAAKFLKEELLPALEKAPALLSPDEVAQLMEKVDAVNA